MRGVLLGVCLTGISLMASAPASGAFTELTRGAESTESHTGLWFGAWIDAAGTSDNPETLIQSTQEAVTGGVAMKVTAQSGSKGRITYEHGLGGTFTPSGLTFYVKASKAVNIRVFRPGTNGSTVVSATTSWQKIDISTSAVDWLLTFELDPVATEETWYIIDRLGLEDSFTATDLSGATTGPDADISTDQLHLGAANVAPIITKLNAQQAFNIVALGDSITAGAQIDLGNGYGWNAATEDLFKYSSTLGAILEQDFGYSGTSITVTNFGHGGWAASQAISDNFVNTEVLTVAGPGDLVILQFGANDLSGGASAPAIAQWKADMKTLIGQVKAGGVTEILVMGITTHDEIIANAAAISTALAEIVSEEGVAAVDVTKFSTFRGGRYAWAYLSNTFHPDASGQMQIGHIASALFSGNDFNVVARTPAGGSGDTTPPVVGMDSVEVFGTLNDSTIGTIDVSGTMTPGVIGNAFSFDWLLFSGSTPTITADDGFTTGIRTINITAP